MQRKQSSLSNYKSSFCSINFENVDNTSLSESHENVENNENQESTKQQDDYFNSSLEPENFLDKIIFLKKNLSEHDKVEKAEKDQLEISSPRKMLLRRLSKITNLDRTTEFLSDTELENKIKDIHIKPDELKSEYEKELEILEQIGLNCIFTKTNEDLDIEKLKARKGKYMEFHNKIIVGNKNWVETKKNLDADFFEKLSKPQKPKYLVIACSDSRVVVNEFTATEPGDVFTHRNIGNLVISTDFNCQSVLQFAVDYLKVEHIMVIGHTDCGAVRAALSYDYHGLIDHWLKNIREVVEKHGNQLRKAEDEGHERIVKKIIELNIKEQCLNLCKSPVVQGAWDRGQDLYIHGFLFEMETGVLKDLEVVQKDWSNIQDIYRYNFRK